MNIDTINMITNRKGIKQYYDCYVTTWLKTYSDGNGPNYSIEFSNKPLHLQDGIY